MAERRLQAIIHIGAEKTGTTTLQEFFHLNREALGAGGVLFPATPGLRQHALLMLACLDPGRENRQTRTHPAFSSDPGAWRAGFADALHAELASAPAGTRQLLVSTELFHTQLLHPREVARLKALLDPFCDDYRIVFYMRRQDRLEVSRYSTNLRAGGTRPTALPRRVDQYLHYERVLARWDDGLLQRVERVNEQPDVLEVVSVRRARSFGVEPRRPVTLVLVGARADRLPHHGVALDLHQLR